MVNNNIISNKINNTCDFILCRETMIPIVSSLDFLLFFLLLLPIFFLFIVLYLRKEMVSNKSSINKTNSFIFLIMILCFLTYNHDYEDSFLVSNCQNQENDYKLDEERLRVLHEYQMCLAWLRHFKVHQYVYDKYDSENVNRYSNVELAWITQGCEDCHKIQEQQHQLKAGLKELARGKEVEALIRAYKEVESQIEGRTPVDKAATAIKYYEAYRLDDPKNRGIIRLQEPYFSKHIAGKTVNEKLQIASSYIVYYNRLQELFKNLDYAKGYVICKENLADYKAAVIKEKIEVKKDNIENFFLWQECRKQQFEELLDEHTEFVKTKKC